MEDLEELREIVDGLTYCAVTPHAPEWYLNPVFKTILGAEDGVFESQYDDHPPFFADHFLRVLKDDEPPSLDFFRLLSSPARGDKPIWGVYSLVLEKQLEAYNAARVARAKQNMAKSSKAYEDREKAVSLAAYCARKLKEKFA
ncbi:hypothetical protein K4K53_011170 [Colletotrichum sp. SAR 10_77]|nr:hypothetical protein K4K53_011170 [Colletotrichum sp. SAR 10_77]